MRPEGSRKVAALGSAGGRYWEACLRIWVALAMPGSFESLGRF